MYEQPAIIFENFQFFLSCIQGEPLAGARVVVGFQFFLSCIPPWEESASEGTSSDFQFFLSCIHRHWRCGAASANGALFQFFLSCI